MRPQATYHMTYDIVIFTQVEHETTFSFFHSLRRSFPLVAPSSLSFLPPRPSFFLVQHCLNHLQSVKDHFSSILTKALPTDRRTDRQGLLWRGQDASKTDKLEAETIFMTTDAHKYEDVCIDRSVG